MVNFLDMVTVVKDFERVMVFLLGFIIIRVRVRSTKLAFCLVLFWTSSTKLDFV